MIDDLYHDLIRDHGGHPRNRRAMPGATNEAEGDNPLCGDRLKLFLRLEGDLVEEASFEGEGCLISLASASVLTDLLAGKTAEEARSAFASFQRLVASDGELSGLPEGVEGGCAFMDERLRAFAGVRAFPSRIKCALLAWHALDRALP